MSDWHRQMQALTAFATTLEFEDLERLPSQPEYCQAEKDTEEYRLYQEEMRRYHNAFDARKERVLVGTVLRHTGHSDGDYTLVGSQPSCCCADYEFDDLIANATGIAFLWPK